MVKSMVEVPSGQSTLVDTAISDAKRGSTRAFTVLYQTFAAEIASFVNARGVQNVDEVVNDVFLGAFRALDRFEGGAREFRAYVYRIARNKISDVRAARRRESAVIASVSTDGCEVADTRETCDVEEVVLAKLNAGQLRSMLEMITPDQRDVILLRFLSGLTVTEVSEVVEKPVSAVKALQRRGLSALRRISSLGVVSV